MVTTYQYDDLNRLILETVKEDGVLVETFDYDQVLLGQANQSQDPTLMLLGDGDRGGEVDTRYNADGTIASQITYAWTYDQDDRLISEELTINAGAGQAGVPTPYLDEFQYDLSNNRTAETISGGSNQPTADTITYTYNSDDQLIDEKEVDAAGNTVYETTYTYDANGNLSTQTRTGSNAENDTYAYDLRNRMTKVVSNGTETDYGYDTNGVRTSEGSPGQTQTYYLNDPNNPTGETKAIEEATGPSQSSAAISRSYVLGLKVEAQEDAAGSQYASDGTVYLLTDGHGSTRALMNSSGQTVETYVYDAFGTLLAGAHTNTATNTTTAITAADTETEWLFGGDGLYDPASGWTYHLARWTDGFWFTQSDFGPYGSDSDPITLHKYLYANANPVYGIDPSGHLETETLATIGILAGLFAVFGLTYLGLHHYGVIGAASNRPINMGSDPRWGVALQYMTSDGLYAAAKVMSSGISDGSVMQNDSNDGSSTTRNQITVIGAGSALNSADLAIELYGEYQRRTFNANPSQYNVAALNKQIDDFDAWLRKHGHAPTRHWAHPL